MLTIKLSRPVRMVDTDQAGFHVSGWKSLIDKHNLNKRCTVKHTTLRNKYEFFLTTVHRKKGWQKVSAAWILLEGTQ